MSNEPAGGPAKAEEPSTSFGRPINRRTFLKAAGQAALLGMPFVRNSAFASAPRTSKSDRPNILFLVVDQMRTPEWFPVGKSLDRLLPSIASIRRGAVNFTNCFSAATLCSPARAGLLTGLYTHQNGLLRCVDGDEPALDPAFQTWGSALRNVGYQTNWYGKWHLSYGDSLDPYGFDGGTFPSPNGGPQEGTNIDSSIVDQFLGWFENVGTASPWATTVSLVNPHDIVYYYLYTEEYFKQHPLSSAITKLPENFESADQLLLKPSLQLAHQLASDKKYGILPYSGDGWEQAWLSFMNAYVAYQQLADKQLGRVLAALDSRPEVRDNTVVVFLSDHGEYAGSHGLRGKGGSAYDEVIRVPLTVKDPTGQLTAKTHIPREQFVSLVDIYGLLLTVATGSDSWRANPQFSHISGRLDVASILASPKAPGRDAVIHTYDEGGAKTIPGSDTPIPGHVIGLRTPDAKLVTYNKWIPESIELDDVVQQTELYDYSTERGRLELDDSSKANIPLFTQMHDRLTNDILPNELRQPLPAALEQTRQNALQSYYTFLKNGKKKRKLGGDTAPDDSSILEGDNYLDRQTVHYV